MLLGQWIKWEPLKNLSYDNFIYKTERTVNSLRIFLINNDEKELLVIFEHSVIFFKSMNEIFASRPAGTPIEYEGCEQFLQWNFFKVANSAYLKMLSDESRFDLSTKGFVHYSIYEEDTFIDVIAACQPKVEWIIK